ncbi:MAG: addiction module protein [Planctomycetales bacterium]|nr:addiction module protein [Planctomycetales bacterium]
MQSATANLLDAALKLSDEERSALALRLMESLPPEGILTVDDPDFEAELERRFADPAGAIPWSELRSEA